MSAPSTRGVLSAVWHKPRLHGVRTWTVILEIRCHGSACGSTTDDIEADSEQEAVEKAIAAWRKLRPDRTFAPLLSAPALGSRDEAT